MKPIISVKNLSKKYKIGHGQVSYGTLRDTVNNALRAPLNWFRGNGNSEENTIWALNDVSFDVMPGEVVGIIGRNGAGKSTLLKILSRITEPTIGQVDLYGRVGSLLEVGTGFHHELSGRENIYLNGAILGMKRSEIDRKFDEIVEFSEIEKFIDTPVKHYSSGMYVRLAFAVAAHLEPEILIVDEVLAVGDFSFQQKCLGRMKELGQEGRTVIFVSHNISALSRLCYKGVLLQGGGIYAEGEIQSVIRKYLQPETNSSVSWSRQDSETPNRGLHIKQIRTLASDNSLAEVFPSNEQCYIEITYEVFGEGVQSRIIVELETEERIVVLTTTDQDSSGGVDVLRDPGVHTCRCVLPPNLLAPGSYYVTACASWTNRIEWDRVSRVLTFRVSRVGSLYVVDNRPGLVAPILSWK